MKNINKVRRTFGKVLEFSNEVQMRRFLYNYSEVFTPYSEETISYEKDADVASWMRLGIHMYNNNKTMVIVNCTIDNFKKIEKMFKKENLRRGKSKFVFTGEA